MNRTSSPGFTLLEVVLALALLAAFSLVIIQAIGQAVMLKTDEERIVTATNLAEAKMVELQIQLLEDGFSDLDEEECGDFQRDFSDYTDDAFQGYEWCWKVKKVKLAIPKELLTSGGLPGDEEAGGGSGTDFVQGEGGGTEDLIGALGIDLDSVTEQLSEGIRMLQVEVKWEDSNGEQHVDLSTHLVRMSEVEGLPQ